MTPKDLMAALAAPFPQDQVEWRPGRATNDKTKVQAFAYLSKDAIEGRLDEVCAMDWQCRYVWDPSAKKTVCEIGIWNGATGSWVWRADGSGDTEFESEKGALSGAYKRAAARWGVGRYLYDIPIPWVKCKPVGTKGAVAFDCTPADIWKEATRLMKAKTPAPKQSEARAPEPQDGTYPMSSASKYSKADYTAAQWRDAAKAYLDEEKSDTAVSTWVERNAATMEILSQDQPSMIVGFRGNDMHFTEALKILVTERVG